MADRPDTIDEQTWTQLSESERSVMTEPDDPPAEVVVEPAVTAPAPTEKPAEATAPTETPAPSEPTQATAPAETPAPAEPPSPAPAAAPGPAPVEVDPYEPPELALPHYDQTKGLINSAIAALDKKFEDGDLSTSQWTQQREAEKSKLDGLDRDRLRVDMRNEERQRYWVYKWNIAQDTFFGGNAELYPPNSPARTEFLALTAELGTQPRFASMPHAQFLAEIDRRVRPLFSTAATPPAAAVAAPPPVKGRVPDLKSVPATLSAVPAADLNSTDEGEFVHIDKLTGEAYEKAIAGLTKAQRERREKA